MTNPQHSSEFSEKDRYAAFLQAPTHSQVGVKGVEIWNRSYIQQLAGTPTHVAESPERTVFGKRMENLLKQALISSERFEVAAENIQIIHEGVTVGELDFILHDLELSRLVHLELAVKFYVYDPTISGELNRWIGPNRRDSLVRKVHKLQNHQFPLLYRTETQKVLKTLSLPDLPWSQALCFKSLLFVPEYPASPLVNHDAVKGHYVHLRDFRPHYNSKFFLPDKRDWICEPSAHTPWVSYEQISSEIKELAQHQRAPLCWMKSPDGTVESFFVVWW